jgi:hypothetical protein
VTVLSRLAQAAFMVPAAVFLTVWTVQALRPVLSRRRLRTRTHELAQLRPLPIRSRR